MQHLFNSKIDIIEVIETSDGLLGKTESTIVIYRNLPCRINFKRGNEKILFNKTTYYLDARIYCNVVDIDVKMRIVYEGVIYEIVNISNPDNLNRYLTVDIKRLE